jgi:hypothetical protein
MRRLAELGTSVGRILLSVPSSRGGKSLIGLALHIARRGLIESPVPFQKRSPSILPGDVLVQFSSLCHRFRSAICRCCSVLVSK